jgi:ribose transport system substrate-binding protein
MRRLVGIAAIAGAVLSMLLLAALASGAPRAKSSPAPSAATRGKATIALSLPAMDNPLMLAFKDVFNSTFGKTYNIEVASADGNPNTQATQIENYTATHVKFLFVMETEATSLLSKLQAARKAGVKVLVAGGDPGARNAYDAVMKMDQFLAGEYCALLAKNWVNKTYPKSAAGSIQTAILESTLTPESVNRNKGLAMISQRYLKDATGAYIAANGKRISNAKGKYLPGKSASDRVKNPTYCPAVKIVKHVEAAMMQDGQTATQNLLTTNPNLKLVLAYSSDGGMGASNAIMDDQSISDKSKVAVFGVGMVGAESQAITDSGNGKGVFRGAVSFGGPNLPKSTVQLVQKMLSGKKYPRITWDPLALGTLVNGKLVIKPVANAGVIVVPKALTKTKAAALSQP